MGHPTVQVTKFTFGTARKMKLTFSDGTIGTVDLRDYIDSKRFGKLFAPLSSTKEFRAAYLDGGTVCWPAGLDVAPEALYAAAHGLAAPKTFEQAKANAATVTLRRLRTDAQLTQVELARALGISQPELSEFEGQREDRRLSTLRRYLAAVGWDLEVVAVQGKKRIPLDLSVTAAPKAKKKGRAA